MRVEIEGLGALENPWSPSPTPRCSEEEPAWPCTACASSRSACPTPSPCAPSTATSASSRRRPGRFETADGGEQLRVAARAAPRAARALDRRGRRRRPRARRRRARAARRRGASARRARSARSSRRPASRVELVVEPRLAQKPAPRTRDERPRPRRCASTRARRPCSPPRPRGRASSSTSWSARRDAAASRRFFVEAIGFRGERRGARRSARASCAARPITTTCSCRPAPFAFLHHTAWEMDDVDAVGRAAAAMVGGGCLAPRLGARPPRRSARTTSGTCATRRGTSPSTRATST